MSTSFLETLFATFIGAFLAFLLGFLLWWLQRRLESRRLRGNIKNDLKANIDFLTDYINDFENVIEKRTNKLSYEFRARHSRFKRYYLDKGYAEGELYELYEPKVIFNIEDMLGKYTQNSDNIWETVINGDTINQVALDDSAVVKLCISERDKLKEDLATIKSILGSNK